MVIFQEDKKPEVLSAIRKCFREILNREVNEEGQIYYWKLLENGKITINNLPEILKNSPEYHQRMIPVKLEKFLKNVPLIRAGTGEDVANLAAFLASDSSGYITGQVINVDGGLLM